MDHLPTWPEIRDYVNAVWTLLFGVQPPTWLWRSLGVVLGCILALGVLWLVLWLVSQIGELWVQHIRPCFYDEEARARAARRRLFAQHVLQEIRYVSFSEDWRDHRFAELEAEVHAEGRCAWRAALPFGLPHLSRPRTERSLSRALERSAEPLILLEGDPGSGKTVALRHVAHRLADKAARSRSTRSLIPLYVNLRELRPGVSLEGLDAEVLRTFILDALRRDGTREVDGFLEEEFDRGMREGTLIFLLDSFDEIPDVLASTHADAAVDAYATAIARFLQSMKRSRGVVASREFRGPGKRLPWPRFRILCLSPDRRRQLVAKAGLKPAQRRVVLDGLSAAPTGLVAMSTNPMFLSLLCTYVHSKAQFPAGVHAVFESYVTQRVTERASHVESRWGLTASQLHEGGEVVAYALTAHPNLGLSPRPEEIATALAHLGLDLPAPLPAVVDGLRYVGLARCDRPSFGGGEGAFAFAHRRFQEYFATRFLLRRSALVPPEELLTNGRWRETAVALFQTAETVDGLVREAGRLLGRMAGDVPLAGADHPALPLGGAACQAPGAGSESPAAPVSRFPWPVGLLHLLGLMQEGLGARLGEVPDSARECAGRILLGAVQSGTIGDRRWATEVAGIAPQRVLLSIVRSAFSSGSLWLREAAVRQLGRLHTIPGDVVEQVLLGLPLPWAPRRPRADLALVRTRLCALDCSGRLRRGIRLLAWAPRLDVLLAAVALAAALGAPRNWSAPWCLALVATSVFSWGYRLADWSGDGARAAPALLWRTRRFAAALGSVPAALMGLSFLGAMLLGPGDGTPRGEMLRFWWGDPALRGVINLLLAYHAAAWGPLAADAASQGRLLSPFLWPLVVPLYAGRWLAAARGWCRRFVDAWRAAQWPGRLALIAKCLAPLWGPAALVGCLLLVSVAFGVSSSLGVAVIAPPLLAISAWLLLLLAYALAQLTAWLHDRCALLRLLANPPEGLAPCDVEPLLSRFRTTSHQTLVVRRLRSWGSVRRSPGAATVIRDLAASVECPEVNVIVLGGCLPVSEILHEWKLAISIPQHFTVATDPKPWELIDELYQLAEQLDTGAAHTEGGTVGTYTSVPVRCVGPQPSCGDTTPDAERSPPLARD